MVKLSRVNKARAWSGNLSRGWHRSLCSFWVLWTVILQPQSGKVTVSQSCPSQGMQWDQNLEISTFWMKSINSMLGSLQEMQEMVWGGRDNAHVWLLVIKMRKQFNPVCWCHSLHWIHTADGRSQGLKTRGGSHQRHPHQDPYCSHMCPKGKINNQL